MPSELMNLPKVAVISDFVEENWPSMDLAAEMLFTNLRDNHARSVEATLIRPPLRRRFTRSEAMAPERPFNADRLFNRLWDYPRQLRQLKGDFDLFHVVDHSYGQLVHQLPPERTVITCHDLDTFRCLLTPERERRSLPFKLMVRRILSGFRKAARVTCDSYATRDQLLRFELIAPERLIVVHNGAHPVFKPEANTAADPEAARLLGTGGDKTIELLHVGSTIERKRIDVLLRVLAELRRNYPQIRLVRVGGPFTVQQKTLISKLELNDAIIVLPSLEREVLAAVYRRAALVLQPSEREGFGLPVVEAMACGRLVVASDLPVLREVGGEAVVYCPVGDIRAWSESIVQLLAERDGGGEKWDGRRAAALARAAKFSWAEYTSKMVDVYRQLL